MMILTAKKDAMSSKRESERGVIVAEIVGPFIVQLTSTMRFYYVKDVGYGIYQAQEKAVRNVPKKKRTAGESGQPHLLADARIDGNQILFSTKV
mmetsp:Transcript_10681/g.25482  ORF Transcript_10681/g.25482 Transcript_10681/m.25482 type:complete len:94 (+) Transcript_10681:406-687(+)